MHKKQIEAEGFEVETRTLPGFLLPMSTRYAKKKVILSPSLRQGNILLREVCFEDRNDLIHSGTVSVR